MARKTSRSTTGTYLRGKIWWFNITIKGKTRFFSSESEDRDVCIDQRNAKIQEMRGSGGDPQKITIPELLDDYLAYLKRENKPGYAPVFHASKPLKAYWPTLRAYQLGSKASEEYRKKRKETVSHLGEPIGDSTVNRELQYLRSAFYHGMKRTDPPTVVRVPNLTIIKSAEDDGERTGTLSPELYLPVRDAIEDEGIRAMFIVAYEVGIRAGELMKMTWDMVDMERGYIFLPWRITKNRNSGALPIWADGDMVPALTYMKAKQQELNHNCPYVFRWCRGLKKGKRIKSYREAWEKARATVGMPELLFHDLRRSTVTNLAMQGFVKEHRQIISRHVEERMEGRYNQAHLHILDQMKQQRQERQQGLKAILAPAPEAPMVLPDSLKKYEKISPADRAIIDGMLAHMPVTS